MMIDAGLRSHLLGDGEIAALVGVRVYPMRLPQKAIMPAIVLTRISGIRYKHLRGAEALARPRYQVDCWASTHDRATELGQLCRQRLNGYSGRWSDSESPQTTISVNIFIDNEQDVFEEEILGGLCRHSADYLIFHSTAEGLV